MTSPSIPPTLLTMREQSRLSLVRFLFRLMQAGEVNGVHIGGTTPAPAGTRPGPILPSDLVYLRGCLADVEKEQARLVELDGQIQALEEA